MIERAGLAALRNLDCTMLLCNEIEPMRSFYVDLLGLDVQREIAGRYLELRIGATTLAFRLRTRPYDGAAPVNTAGSVQLAFRVPPPDVEVAAAQLIEHGVELLEPVRDLPDFGHRVLFFADPDHNVIEIYGESEDHPRAAAPRLAAHGGRQVRSSEGHGWRR
ncbi:MAG: VOC family protein [Acidimicrobiales bacterium]